VNAENKVDPVPGLTERSGLAFAVENLDEAHAMILRTESSLYDQTLSLTQMVTVHTSSRLRAFLAYCSS
jgi:hypothetical protein